MLSVPMAVKVKPVPKATMIPPQATARMEELEVKAERVAKAMTVETAFK